MLSKIGLVVVALTVVGCATEELDTSATDQALIMKGCVDPDDCLASNGGGVYTEEVGFAGFGPDKFMITTFINLTDANGAASGVNVQGRAFDSSRGIWIYTTARLDHALIDNRQYPVLSVTEWLTSPTFTLKDGTNPNKVVSDDQLKVLQLVVVLGEKTPYTLSFGEQVSDVGVTGGTGSVGAKVFSYPMFWNVGTSKSANPTDYCKRALQDGQVTRDPDTIVFQQGIAVDPVTAVMARNGAYVSMSCRRGAIANARSWGYIYRQGEDPSVMFEAAMHMKRASYCGDETFYTRRDTQILISDKAGIQRDGVNSSNVEARWGRALDGRIRALCVNYAPAAPELRRHYNARYPLNTGVRFMGDCFDVNGNREFTIPTCEDFDAAGGSPAAVLSDAADPPSP